MLLSQLVAGGPLEPVFPSIFDSALIASKWSGNFLGLRVSKRVRWPIKKRDDRGGDVFSIDLGGTLVDPNSLSEPRCITFGLPSQVGGQ